MDRRLAELHLEKARERAFRLLCTGSTIIPKEYDNFLSEQIVVDIAEFALHARRLNEICGLRAEVIDGVDSQRFQVAGYPATLETNYHDALNRLMHAKQYTVGYSIWNGEKIYTQSENNLIPSYIQIKTDRKPTACVSIFGVAYCFLTSVIPLVKAAHPSIEF